MRQSSRQIAVLSAQELAGILYALVGPAILFLLDGVSFVFAGATELLIRPAGNAECGMRNAECGRGAQRPAPRFFGDAADGFRYVAAQPGMVGFLIAASVFNALLMPITVLLPVFVTVYLQADVRCHHSHAHSHTLQPRRVSIVAIVLVSLMGIAAGAGAAGVMFHGRVVQIFAAVRR